MTLNASRFLHLRRSFAISLGQRLTHAVNGRSEHVEFSRTDAVDLQTELSGSNFGDRLSERRQRPMKRQPQNEIDNQHAAH